MLPPGNIVIVLSDGGNGCRQNYGVDVKFASKLDFSAEALVAHPGLHPPPPPMIIYKAPFKLGLLGAIKIFFIMCKLKDIRV